MSYLSPIHSHAEVTSTLGTSFWIRADSASNYALDPAFLRFLTIAIGLFALLDQGHGGPHLQGWQVPFLWLCMAGMVLLSSVATLNLILRLVRRGTLRRLYTPVMFLPILVAVEATSQSVVWLLDLPDPQPLPLALPDLARTLLVLFLFDLLHVHYVVPTHPLAQLSRPVVAPNALTDTGPQPRPPISSTSPDHPTIQIADKVFALSELLSLRTEDHYLNVITRSGRSMLRAKLSDITPLHDGRHGVQINRSQWVSFAAITAVTDAANGQLTLHLADGDSATVSRTRRLMVLQLYTAYKAQNP